MTHSFHRKFFRPGAVRNSAGFEVEYKGLFTVRYSEPGRAATFAADQAILEYGDYKGQRGRIVAISKLDNWDDGTPLSEAERKLIRERTEDGLKFIGAPHILI
jgi:hypothetical protein